MLRLRKSQEHFFAQVAVLLLSVPGLSCGDECKCADDDHIEHLPVMPFSGAINVPINTKIWGNKGLRLLDAGGNEVPTVATTIDVGKIGTVTVLDPSGALEPNHQYALEGVPGNEEHSFTTGKVALTEMPPVPNVIDLDQHRDRECGTSYYGATYSLNSVGAAHIYVLDSGTADSLGLETPDRVRFSTVPSFELGASCGGDNFPGGASKNATTSVRFASFDLAGNFSGWSEPESLTLTGCNLGGAQSTAFLVIVPFLLCGRRRWPCR